MTVHHILMCFFFLSLQDGISGRFDPDTFVYATEGGDVQVSDSFLWFGDTKFFCKEECKEEDVLVETTNKTAQSGRYTIKYSRSYVGEFLSVTITNLTKSDSGQYRYGFKTGSGSYYSRSFEINVEDAFLDGNPPEVKTLYAKTRGNIIVACPTSTSSRNLKFFCKDKCEQDILLQTTFSISREGRYSLQYDEGSSTGGSLHVSIKELNESDSGWYSCGMVRPFSQESYRLFKILVSDDPAASKEESIQLTSTPPPRRTQSSDVLLYLVGILVIVVIILGLVLTIICIRRKLKPDGSRTTGNSAGANTEIGLYENCSPDSPCEDSTYESLDPAARDKNRTYSTLAEHD